MNAVRVSIMPYRVDWFDDDLKVAKVFGFSRFDKAFDKMVEGASEGYDEVCMYDFTGGRTDAVLIARFVFNRRKLFHASTDKTDQGVERRVGAYQ